MIRFSLNLLLTIAVVLIATAAARYQTPCKPPEIVFSRNVANIFTEEQDVFLGDALAETVDKEVSVINDDRAAAYLREIGERLARHLPPTAIKFRFFVVDAPEVNAFAVAGGRIYVTRKLIAFVKSEDELAGILGHEMGHAIVRHPSSDFSKAFKEILNVNGFRDRDDVYNRVHELIDRSRTKRIRQKASHGTDQQLEADRIGVYAMTAAGYDPEANITAWERANEIAPGEDLSGGLFGSSRPEHKRLREMLKALKSIPPECREGRSASRSDAFREWQTYVVSIANIRHRESLTGVIKRGRLQPYLRGSVTHLRFSPDGQYIIAQDASGINVLRRERFAFLFRIRIDGAKPAHFSPDSKQIVVQTYGLRVEAWDIEKRRPSTVSEVHVRDRCIQSALSPDGKTLVCYQASGDLQFIDVATSEKVFTKEKFFKPTMLFAASLSAENTEAEILDLGFSPDGKFFLAAASVRIVIAADVERPPAVLLSVLGLDQKEFIALDLTDRKEIKVPDSIKPIASGAFTFYSNDKIIGHHRSDDEKSGIFTFPQGERVEKHALGGRSYQMAAGGSHMIIRPVSTGRAGVYSFPLKKIVYANKSAAIDGFGDTFVSEGLNGSVELLKINGETAEKIASVALPKNDLGNIRAIAVSDNLDRIALSERARGAVWDLTTGERKIYIRGFQGAYFDPTGVLYADLPSFENEVRSIALIDPTANTAKAVRSLPPRRSVQNGRFMADSLPASLTEEDSKDPAKVARIEERVMRERSLSEIGFSGSGTPAMRLDISEASSGKLLWSKKFESDLPVYSFSPDGKTVTFRWQLAGKEAKDIIRSSPELSEKARRMGNKAGDYLFQVLDASSGTPIGHLLIETGEGSFRIRQAFAAGDYLTLIDSENRVVIYSIKNGELKGRFFGEGAAVNPSAGIAGVMNFPGVLSLEDLNTGKKAGELRFASPIAYVRFSADGTRLFVLTAAQDYFVFDVGQIAQR